MTHYPYHRYLTYRVLKGDGAQEIIDHLAQLEYTPPTIGDVEELIRRLRRHLPTSETRREYGVSFFDEACPSLDGAFWIVETPAVRACAERLLLDGIDPKSAATILGIKFDGRITIKTVELFRDGFWDTVLLSPHDFYSYFLMSGRKKHEPPPDSVSLETRGAYAAWKQGLHPDEASLSAESMVREIQVDAFMRFKESSDPRMAKGWAETVLKTATARRSLAESHVDKDPDLFSIKTMLEYPDTEVPTLSDLHTEYSQETSGTGAEAESMSKKDD